MLGRVRQTWIEQVLERSLAKRARVALGLGSWPEAGPRGPIAVLRRGHASVPLSTDTTVSKVFDDAGGGLLILGPPGSGKTTTLLRLARDLLDRADHDAQQPMPVVFNLASWARRRPPLADWLADELHHSYDVPRRIAGDWVARNDVLPLLDGLDEIAAPARTACVTAISEFRRTYPSKLAVCGCAEEHETLVTGLGCNDAVVLGLPTREQVVAHLAAAGASLRAVRDGVDSDHTLADLVRSPLLLNVAMLTYQGQPATALPTFGTPEQRRARLFADYTERMFVRQPLGVRHKERAIRWLTRLARSMREHSHGEFDLDRLQPDWLPHAVQRRLVTLVPAVFAGLVGGLLVSLVLGLRGGLAAGIVLLVVAVIGGRAYQPLERSRWTPFFAMGAVIVLGVALAIAWAFGRSSVALVLVLVAVAGGRAYGLLRGGGVEGAWAVIEPVERRYRSGPRPGFRLSVRVVGLVGGLIALRVATEVVGNLNVLALGVFAGAVALSELISELAPKLADALADRRATPNEGIHRSARHGFAIGLVVWLTLWLAVTLLFVLRYQSQVALGLALVRGLSLGLGPGLVLGLAFGLDFGGIACLRHLALRAFLVRNGEAPWRYVRFLDEATDRLFLYKSGGSYIFVHRLLLKYFADLNP